MAGKRKFVVEWRVEVEVFDEPEAAVVARDVAQRQVAGFEAPEPTVTEVAIAFEPALDPFNAACLAFNTHKEQCHVCTVAREHNRVTTCVTGLGMVDEIIGLA